MAVTHPQSVLAAIAISGRVESNAVQPPSPLAAVKAGDNITLSFHADPQSQSASESNVHAYKIIASTFNLAFETAKLNISSTTPSYFVLYKGMPKADGFWVSSSPQSPGGVPIVTTPDGFQATAELGYEGGTLPSTDIIAAAGVYKYDNLTRFGFDVWKVIPDNIALGFSFEALEIRKIER